MAIKSEPFRLCSWNFWNFLFSMRQSNGEYFKDFKIFDLTWIWWIWLEWPQSEWREWLRTANHTHAGPVLWHSKIRSKCIHLISINLNLISHVPFVSQTVKWLKTYDLMKYLESLKLYGITALKAVLL